MWPLVPVLQAAGAVMPDQGWLVLTRCSTHTAALHILVANRACGGDECGDNRRLLTILLTNWLLQTGSLETINPEDLANWLLRCATLARRCGKSAG